MSQAPTADGRAPCAPARPPEPRRSCPRPTGPHTADRSGAAPPPSRGVRRPRAPCIRGGGLRFWTLLIVAHNSQGRQALAAHVKSLGVLCRWLAAEEDPHRKGIADMRRAEQMTGRRPASGLRRNIPFFCPAGERPHLLLSRRQSLIDLSLSER